MEFITRYFYRLIWDAVAISFSDEVRDVQVVHCDVVGLALAMECLANILQTCCLLRILALVVAGGLNVAIPL